VRFVDSHLHIIDHDPSAILSIGNATQTLLVNCGTDRETSKEALGLARLNPGRVKAFVGVHPSEAVKAKGLDWIRRALAEACGLGEVGLDPTYSSVGPRGAQMKVFQRQLEFAQTLRKPVQVHSRRAESEVFEVLSGFRIGSVLMHWLESEEALPEALGRGYFVSFGPALLYSKRLQRMAASAPPDQVLTETDSPVTYGPLGGVRGPSLVPSVIFSLAELWGLRFEEAGATVVANARRFLGLSEKG
jgi:TatD DNase family protein